MKKHIACMFATFTIALLAGCAAPSPGPVAVQPAHTKTPLPPTKAQASTRTATVTPTKTHSSTYTYTPTFTSTFTPIPSPTPTATPLGGGSGRLVFFENLNPSHHPSGQDLYVMDSDGSNVQLLIDDPDPINYFLISPDGQYIAYTTGWVFLRKLKIAEIDGSQSRVLIENFDEENHSRFSWSPDSRSIAYINRGDVFLISHEGDHIQQLTDTTEKEWNPQWSPNGTMIAFLNFPEFALYLMNSDGTNRKRISDTGKISPNFVLWSPDSAKIAFIDGCISLVDFSINWIPGCVPVAWSVDSHLLYCIEGRRLMTYSTVSDEYSLLLELDNERWSINNEAFSPDGKVVLLVVIAPKSNSWTHGDIKKFIYRIGTGIFTEIQYWGVWIP